jgi:hypothetical protein
MIYHQVTIEQSCIAFSRVKMEIKSTHLLLECSLFPVKVLNIQFFLCEQSQILLKTCQNYTWNEIPSDLYSLQFLL